MEIRRAGDRALLVETEAPHAFDAAVRAAALPGVIDVVPGARTVLVVTEGPLDVLDRALRRLTVGFGLCGGAAGRDPGRLRRRRS